LLNHGFAIFPISRVNPNLDQFMMFLGQIDLVQYGRRDAILTGNNNRFQ